MPITVNDLRSDRRPSFSSSWSAAPISVVMSERRGPIPDPGTPGASARGAYTSRKASRERRAREKHPRIGGLLLALQDEPQHQKAWERGAAGEQQVATSLAKYLRDDVIVLHDRRIPGTRANIDHIVVARSGVWVIDAKRYKGKARIDRPLFGAPKLVINGRDQTKLIQALDRQVGLVHTAMEQIAPDTPTRGALCFIDTGLPLVRALTLDGYPLLRPRALAKRINCTSLAGDGTSSATRRHWRPRSRRHSRSSRTARTPGPNAVSQPNGHCDAGR